MTHTPLMNIPACLKAIKTARLVWVQPRFGTTEAWLPVSKTAAVGFLRSSYRMTDLPEDCEMSAGHFGTVDSAGNVFLG